MDKQLKAKWLKALRSGKLKQTKGRLIRGVGRSTGYCCLGVLEKVCGTPRARIEADADNITPKIAGQWVYRGVDIGMRKHLAVMNDGDKDRGLKRHSFKEIADYIEANL